MATKEYPGSAPERITAPGGGTQPSSEAISEAGTLAGALELNAHYAVDNRVLRYIGQGVSGLHWFAQDEPVLRAVSLEPARLRELLDSGQMKPCPTG